MISNKYIDIHSIFMPFCIVFAKLHARRSSEGTITKSVPYLVTSLPPFLFSNSFPCHTSENSPVSPSIATLPKTAVSKPNTCHTSEPPRGCSRSDSAHLPRPCRGDSDPVGKGAPNSHGIISFADPHPLNSVVSYRCEITGREATVSLRPFDFQLSSVNSLPPHGRISSLT
jgi:hypothetical protein